jgi:hypothetical protein
MLLSRYFLAPYSSQPVTIVIGNKAVLRDSCQLKTGVGLVGLHDVGQADASTGRLQDDRMVAR